MNIHQDKGRIIESALAAAQPDAAVKAALARAVFRSGRIILVGIGKAAWQMSRAACDVLGDRIDAGIVITKYGHSKGPIPRLRIFEAGHPVPDKNTFDATKEAQNLVSGLSENDTVLFLISGGGSALFENPFISPEELADITAQLLACGADIVEMNTIRKRLSRVKGGRFAENCAPATVFAVALSDVLGDRPDMIASGPAASDTSTSKQALAIINKYGLRLSETAYQYISCETPKQLNNVEMHVTGSARVLCQAAEATCRALGYEPIVLTDTLSCTAREAGSFLAAIARYHSASSQSRAFILGGETVVRLTGTGLGGRNQELVLSAADGISGLADTAVFSIGSDGTDGPTDAAGGWCDGTTREKLLAQSIDIPAVLDNNDSYHALLSCDGLIKTGPTGTNVNDLTVLLIKR